MNFLNIEKPIVIISNYRTGSTSLGKYLASEYKVPWLPEPIKNQDYYNILRQSLCTGDIVVMKMIVDQLPDVPDDLPLLESRAYKIRLLRRNKLAHVVSYYIAQRRQVWKQTVPKIASYTVVEDRNLMERLVDEILKNDEALVSIPVNFDLTCYYEDLPFDKFGKAVNYQTTLPENYAQIVELARKVLCQINSVDC